MMVESIAARYNGPAQALPAKRLIATPRRARIVERTSKTQNELVGRSKAPVAKATEGTSHNFIRASAEEAYQVTANSASSIAMGILMPNASCMVLVAEVKSCIETAVP